MESTRKDSFRHRIHDILTVTGPKDGIGRIFARTSIVLILLSSVSIILESVAEFRASWGGVFEGIQAGTTYAFLVEYLLRLWSCTVEHRYSRPLVGRLRFAVKPLQLVDLVAILSYFVTSGAGSTLATLRSLRLLRLLSAVRMVRYAKTVKLFLRVFRAKWGELQVALTLNAILIVIASTLLYVVENRAQPNVYSSIPATMWWAATTLTTVGYGDIFPITPLGKLLTAILAFFGIGLFALPTGIIASGFMQEALAHANAEGVCPMCRKPRS